MPRVALDLPVPEIRDRLRERAHVHEDPGSYVAGVDAALDLLEDVTEDADA